MPHEGVTAQALERKGIISDRCEINRQIKADNALLRELKAEIKKLAALVVRTVPAIAEGLEKLRSRVLIFCYQLSRIRSGKAHIQKSLAVWKPDLERYTGLVQQIKEKSKERKTLVAEKKELPIYHVKRHKALAVRIAGLTEDLEELRSEKMLLLQKFEYAEDAGAEAFRKDIATMEAGLKKLEPREQKYSVELDNALTEYAELKAQTADFDPVELYEARQSIRPAQEKAAEQQLEDTTQEKPSLIMLLVPSRERLICLERMQKNGRHGRWLCTEIKSSIKTHSVNEKEMTLSGNHVKGGGSYESPPLLKSWCQSSKEAILAYFLSLSFNKKHIHILMQSCVCFMQVVLEGRTRPRISQQNAPLCKICLCFIPGKQP